MPTNAESKHDAFLRLMQGRLERALEKLRLVAQLSSNHYENTGIEAEEVIRHLDSGVKKVARIFGVPYSTAIGAAAHRAAQTGHLVTNSKGGRIDEVDIAKALDLIKRGQVDEAYDQLRNLLLQKAS